MRKIVACTFPAWAKAEVENAIPARIKIVQHLIAILIFKVMTSLSRYNRLSILSSIIYCLGSSDAPFLSPTAVLVKSCLDTQITCHIKRIIPYDEVIFSNLAVNQERD
jgi:hypothetical protein